jgi:gamma-glutamylcysteine synthetase
VPFVKAFTALIWTLFYDQQAFYKVSLLYENISHKELINLRNSVIDQGRGAKFRGQFVFRLIEQLLDIARSSLNELAKETNSPYINSTLLQPLDLLIEKNITCAEWIKNHFLELNKNNLPILLKAFDPLNNPL